MSYKTMLARRIAELRQLDPLTRQEQYDILRLRYISGMMLPEDMGKPVKRPFRAPHYTVSKAGLTGSRCRSCRRMRPGEFTLAHLGVLLLDEVEEFSRSCLDALREPLRDGKILQADVGWSPADFQLVVTASDVSRFSCNVPEQIRKQLVVLAVDRAVGQQAVADLDAYILGRKD
jgi:magnesium chelatase family protein